MTTKQSHIHLIGNIEENFYVLEMNTLPGLTETSLVPKAAKAAGMSTSAFANKVLANKDDYNAKTEKLLVKSKTKWCMTDPKTHRPKRISEVIQTIFDE